jgi:tetraacyldisaccharide 4'-kinase
MLRFLQYLLLPLALLYELVLRFRNLLYDANLVAPSQFDIPTIVIGNLAFGGTGKTPHTEYLIKLLRDKHKLGVLSRGYGRRTNGYFFADENTNALFIGDEPYQIHLANPDVAVGVCENRVLGIPHLLYDAPETEVVLLDDAYQHRPLQASLNILLTDFNKPYFEDFLVPSGYLREYRGAAKRASIIIVSKCPPDLSEAAAAKIKAAIKPLAHQHVFFSCISYGKPVSVFEPKEMEPDAQVLAFASIAQPAPFLTYLEANYTKVTYKWYADHHILKPREIQDLEERFQLLNGPTKAIITTAKDSSKLVSIDLPESFTQLPIFYLPLTVKLLFNQEQELLQHLEHCIATVKANQSNN